ERSANLHRDLAAAHLCFSNCLLLAGPARCPAESHRRASRKLIIMSMIQHRASDETEHVFHLSKSEESVRSMLASDEGRHIPPLLRVRAIRLPCRQSAVYGTDPICM